MDAFDIVNLEYGYGVQVSLIFQRGFFHSSLSLQANEPNLHRLKILQNYSSKVK